jgi:hypothetical protein
MYSNNMNPKIGETFDRRKRDEYFRKAIQGYGDAFSIEADAARSFLVGRNDIPLNDRLDYYEWLSGFEKEKESASIYPVQTIEEHVRFGDPPEMTKEEMKLRVDHLNRYLRVAVPAVEKMILRRVRSPAELKRIAERFPDRSIGEIAKQGLQRWQDKQLNFDQVLNSDAFLRAMLLVEADGATKHSDSQHSELTKDREFMSDSTRTPVAVSSKPRLSLLLGGIGACVLIVVVIVVMVRLRRHSWNR